MNNKRVQLEDLDEIAFLIKDMNNKQLKDIVLGLSKHVLESETGKTRILLELLSATTHK